MKTIRALAFALPLSLMLWGMLLVAARDTVPASYRHVIKADARDALTHMRHVLKAPVTV